MLPEVELPGLGEEPPSPPLEATLTPQRRPEPPPAPAAAPKAAPKAPRPSRAVPPGPAAVPAPQVQPEPVAAAPVPEAAPVAAPEPAPPAAVEPRLPPRGRIRFVVIKGEQNFEVGLPPGAQDFISFYYAFGYLPQVGATVDLPVSTGRKLDTIRFTRVGEEVLELAFGSVPTVHLRASGDTTTEVWLATDRLLLPVKIRHIDKKGERFDQIATELKVGSD